MKTALILFAHGARDPEWANPMRRVQAAVRSRQPGVPIELAFLEFMTPTLPECIAGLLADGVGKIVVMPMFIARGGHLKRDVPEMLAALRAEHPDVEFVLGDAIGEHETVVQAMAAAALLEAGLQIAG
jgi:sirohydrochlorin cobaltochelatase